MKNMKFDLNKKNRKKVFERVMEKLECFYNNTQNFSITPSIDVQEIKEFVNNQDLKSGGNYNAAIDHVTTGLEKYSVHTSHPKYGCNS